MATIDLGVVTAYAYAVAGGYTGTEQEFEELLGNIATDLAEIENLTVTANTLPAGSSATASYSNGVLTLGIPKGDKGDKGDTGSTGATGATGNGIASITLTSTVGAVHTYTITYTNGQTTTFDVTDGEVTTASLTATLADYARIDGYYEDLTAGYAENLISNVFEEDSVPYNFRTAGGSLDIGSFENDTVVGGSLPWNQYADNNAQTATVNGVTFTNNGNGSFTVNGTATQNATYRIGAYNLAMVKNHVYLLSGCPAGGSDSTFKGTLASLGVDFGNGGLYKNTPGYSLGYYSIVVISGTTVNNIVFKPQFIDLTLLFGTTIADYIYTLETGQAGAGVSFFRKLFPKSYYPYNTGELMHVQTSGHKMVGFNQWDEVTELGGIDASTGQNTSGSSSLRCKNYIQVVPSTSYYVAGLTGGNLRPIYYDADKNYISAGYWQGGTSNNPQTTPSNCHYMRFYLASAYGTTYKNDICINLHWDGERDGEYEAYEAHEYALDSSLTLRGIPKLDASNNLYYDGDTYESDGTVTRRYGVVDLGTLSWFYETNNQVFYAEISDIYARTSGTPNYAINAKYADENVWLASALTDKKFFIRGDIKRIYVKDTAYSTSASFKSSVSNVYLVYLLATPTTETADAFQNPQAVSNWGTEEYIDGRTIAIPVGHNTEYPADLKAKVETSPNPPYLDGDYIVRHINGQSEYIALSASSVILSIQQRLDDLEGN